MSVTARIAQHPLLRPLITTQRRNVPWPVALRNTAAIVLPLVAGEWAGQRGAGLAVATGALVTMFADQPGPYRLRLQRLLLAALAAGVAALAGSWLGRWPDALLVTAAAWSFAAALLVAVGPHATRAGLISMILLIIMGDDREASGNALAVAGLIFAGGALQALFAIAAWPLQRYRPERLALAQAFRALAGFARAPAAGGHTSILPPSLDDLQALLFGSGHARGRASEAFRVLAELAERMRIELLALADMQAGATPPWHDDLQALRGSAAQVLDALASALSEAAPPRAGEALGAYAAATASLENAARDDVASLAHAAAARAQSLGGQLRAAVRNTDAAGSAGELRAQRAEFRLPRALRPANPLATLRANLRLSSPAFRHAFRCGLCIAIALALTHLLPLSRAYWLPMTVAIVLKPDFGATWRYGLLRVAGTLGGLLLTTAILHAVGVGDFWISLGVLAVLCFAYRELAAVHYGIAVVCLTGLVVILLSFHGIPAESAVKARAIDTVLGSALALAAYLLWPTWERGREREVLAHMLDAYRGYLVAVLRGDARERHETRIAARASRSAAQASVDRLAQEPASRANLPRAEALLAHANRFVRVAMLLEAARGDGGHAPTPPELAVFIDACDAALAECASALRDHRAPTGDWRLRERQRSLAGIFDAPTADPDAWTAALRDASDRIVDAIDSLLHVLARPRKTRS